MSNVVLRESLKAGFRRVRTAGATVFAAKELSDDWIDQMVVGVHSGTIRAFEVLALPDSSTHKEAVVKIYHARPNHNLWRRLRAGRAVREGAGYMAFSQRGIHTPCLLLWGEARRWGLFQWGIVVTERVEARTISEVYSACPDNKLLDLTLFELVKIHRAGLAHGDPWLRNFFVVGQQVLTFDLPSWSYLSPDSQIQDLVRFMASTIKLTGNLDHSRLLLQKYEAGGLVLALPAENLIATAVVLAAAKRRT